MLYIQTHDTRSPFKKATKYSSINNHGVLLLHTNRWGSLNAFTSHERKSHKYNLLKNNKKAINTVNLFPQILCKHINGH